MAAVLMMPAYGAMAAPPSAASQAQDREVLEKLNARWLKSYKSHDATALEEILADDFVGVYGQRALSKAELVAAASNRKRNVTDISWENLQIHLAGDTAVVTAISSLKGSQDGRDISARNQYADVYVRRDGRWVAIAAHVIRLDR